ncbi:uncharacterized protein [Asterias amurensis]|uniref:uncharacterized protein n=1 Tax=Asterias amurensis TaxID=7602 RepID=UPI003AB2ACF8
MMMLHGTQHSDSPVVESRPKEVSLLPPLSTNRKCIQKNCDSADDSDEESRTSQFLTTRWRSKSKKGPDRLTVNQSSMSDSFVLPRINGSSQSNTEHHDRSTRKSRTSLSFPKRSRDTCIPLSKSCPSLMNNAWRRSSRVGDTPDGYEDDNDDDTDDDEFEDSESSQRDLKSRSHNSELLRLRKSNCHIDENCNHHKDMTDGVVRKLAKLESPRGKNNHRQHSKTKESETKFPDIFNSPNSLSTSQQLFKKPDLCEQSKNTQISQGHTKTRLGNLKSKPSCESIEPEFRIPEYVEGVRDNSVDMDCSPWDANGKVEADRQQYSKPSTRVGKKKRKQQKRQRTHGEQLDKPNLIRDVTQADIKCRTWLVEGHQESAPKLATSEQSEVI